MEWIRIIGILAIFFGVVGFYLVYRFKMDFQNLDKEQSIQDDFLKKWIKRLNFGVVCGVLATILGIASVFFISTSTNTFLS